ncbi:MAG: hypothetical protein HC867_00730 [Bacteroidia bacterium]|nr:hypothetical protein [Bacteroidia bacterium]
MKKQVILFILLWAAAVACRKAQVAPTESNSPALPWADSSSSHPENAALKALLDKYYKKGLPGIALLVTDNNGAWVGSVGKADMERNVSFSAGQISKSGQHHQIIHGHTCI